METPLCNIPQIKKHWLVYLGDTLKFKKDSNGYLVLIEFNPWPLLASLLHVIFFLAPYGRMINFIYIQGKWFSSILFNYIPVLTHFFPSFIKPIYKKSCSRSVFSFRFFFRWDVVDVRFPTCVYFSCPGLEYSVLIDSMKDVGLGYTDIFSQYSIIGLTLTYYFGASILMPHMAKCLQKLAQKTATLGRKYTQIGLVSPKKNEKIYQRTVKRMLFVVIIQITAAIPLAIYASILT
jgi:hypothetical protein